MKSSWSLGPSLVSRDFAMGHISWGVTSALLIFDSHRSSALLWAIRLIAFETHLTAFLHAGSLVSCHNFRSLYLCFNNRSKPGRSLLGPKSVILLIDSLYAEAIEAEKPRATLSATTPDLILILVILTQRLGFETDPSLNFSIWSERFLILTWSNMWNITGRWSESKISETITSDTLIFWWTTISSTSPFPLGE
jgi:hypothetical protein